MPQAPPGSSSGEVCETPPDSRRPSGIYFPLHRHSFPQQTSGTLSPSPAEPDLPRPDLESPRPGDAQGGDGFDARLLAEAVRIHEAGEPILDGAVEATARRAGGNLERRILVRAQVLDDRLGLSQALTHVQGALGLAAAVVLVGAALAGVATAQAAIDPRGDGVVNFFVVLFAALGPATAALAFWLISALLRRTRAAGLLGRIAADLAGRLVLATRRDASHVAALRAVGGVMAGGPYGRWTLGTITHAAWLAFLAALLAMLLFLLSTRSYVFVWETTILSDEVYVPLTRWLCAIPALVGFPTPSTEEVRASQWTGTAAQAAGARDVWAGLLVGCIAVYGIAPRLALVGLCAVLRRRAARRFRLDTSRPGYARLAPRLMPAAESTGFADRDEGVMPRRPHQGLATAERIEPDPQGPVAVLGLEIDEPRSGWPVAIPGARTLDLGCAQGRHDVARAIEILRRAQPSPRLLVLVCALTTTPDRGVLAEIDMLAAASAIPLRLLLTGGQRLRDRISAENVEQRIADWRALAKEAGIEDGSVLELDLDHLTERSRARLAALTGGAAAPEMETDRLERAFALIRKESAGWRAAPDLETQAELHRAIARLYEGAGSRFRLFDPGALAATDLVERVKAGSELLIGLLPGRLALDPRWLAAGGLAGALGCVAVATLAAPAALAGLPLWAGLGAAVAAALRHAGGGRAAAPEMRPDLAGAVEAAALFALVLEAQGHDEAAITRLIDAAVGDEDAALDSGAAIAAWLERVLRRYRAAEMLETARP